MNIDKTNVTLLNEKGVLSSSLLMRIHKISKQDAREILKQILRNFDNVKSVNMDIICLKEKDINNFFYRKKRLSKWKDVTRP